MGGLYATAFFLLAVCGELCGTYLVRQMPDMTVASLWIQASQRGSQVLHCVTCLHHDPPPNLIYDRMSARPRMRHVVRDMGLYNASISRKVRVASGCR